MKSHQPITPVLLLFAALIACKKTDTIVPAPSVPVVPFAGCRIDVAEVSVGKRYKRTYGYDATTGLIDNINETNMDNPNEYTNLKFTYENGLVVGLLSIDVDEVEKYEYTNGGLNKITVIRTPEKDYVGYQLTVETDAGKRIIAMTDSKGYRCDITRDANGNVVTVTKTKIADKSVVFQRQLSDFDGKKSIAELHKGWPIDLFTYYGDYINGAGLLNDGAGGNARKVSTTTADLTYKYTYSPEGYPIYTEIVDKNAPVPVSTTRYSLKDCK